MDHEDRYARHRLIDGWDQERLAAARILVAGAGAIGNEVIKLLALLGIGHVLIVDFDTVEMTNLTRSPLFRESDIGRPKSDTAARRAEEINPGIKVRSIQGDLQYDVGLGIYRSMDLVIGCLDSLDARLALSRNCRRAQTPWLNGAIEVTVAEVSLFGPRDGACFECGMSPSMWERRRERYSCSGLRSAAPEMKMPTTAIVASLAAAYLVQEALFLLHADSSAEKEGLRFSEKITLSLKPYETAVYALPVNPECCAHECYDAVEVNHGCPANTTAADLLTRSSAPDAVVELGYDLLTELRCIACGSRTPVRRPLERCGVELIRCPDCGADSRSPEIVNWLDAGHPLSIIPLAEIGVPDHAILCVKDSNERRYLQLQGRPIWG